jgi:hypothetical protein
MSEATFSERMSESDHAGNIHGTPKTTYHRARTVWLARLSSDSTLAAKARDMIAQLDANTTTLGRATRLLELETPYSDRLRRTDTPTRLATIQRIAATLDGLAQVADGIRVLDPTEFTTEDAEDLAKRISVSCNKISKIIRRLRRAGK